MAPTEPKNIEEIDKGEAPQIEGKNPPTIEPIAMPIQTSVFELMALFYHKK